MSGDVDLCQRTGGRVGVCTCGRVLVYTYVCMGRWNSVGACAHSQRQELRGESDPSFLTQHHDGPRVSTTAGSG